METSQTINLYITYVEKEGPFLKVWGQTEKNNSIYVEQFLLSASPQFDLGVGKISVDSLQAGTLVCAKYKDNKYYRARITNASFLNEGFVEVSFLDYGNRDVVPYSNIRSLQNFPSSFISVPPLATGFIFAEAHCPGGGEWNDTVFENISKEIKYREVQCTLVIQATQYYLVKLYIGGSDLCSLLINRGLMQPISLQAQQAVLLSMSMQRSHPIPAQPAPVVSTGINTYKACTLEPGCQYPVYVSYVNDGPCHFSVQLKQSEEVLVMLMNDINSITLRPLDDVPIPGTVCLARCQEDGNVCRAVVTNEVDNQFKVFYVDFGNYEVVPLDALYQIPFKYVIPKVMAIRFSLAGVEKSTVTIEMQCAFKQFVDNRLLYMKVLPTPTRMAIPKCELWDPETKTSALDVVNRAAQHAYPEPVSLNRGFSQLVKVSYVHSCNKFYVQLVSKENELLKLMLDLQASCQTSENMDPSSIKVGLPCCALFESDQQWYRSQIAEVLSHTVKVRYIDYGNEELVPISQLKVIDGEQLTVLRPQAIECCLNGYQNMEEDLERDGLLEDLILEGQFTMKVIEMTNKKALVELFDNSNYNIASLLLDKLASAKSQVSPMLVQAGNKIEHRKSFSNQNGPREQNYRQDRKFGRPNDKNENSWRQESRHEKKDFRNNDRNMNEDTKEKSSWRQNNKGFSPNSDNFANRDKNRNRSEWNNKERSSNSDWNNKENEVSDNWNSTSTKTQENDDWDTPSNNTSSQNNSRQNDFRGKSDRPFKDSWKSDGPKTGGFKKKNDYRKDGSDLSSNGSEKGFHQKGPRTSSRNDRPHFQKKFDKPRNAHFNDTTGADDSWNVSPVSTAIDAAPATATFTRYDVVGTDSEVIISWFHNPGLFYCQLATDSIQDQFKNLMTEIQQFYKGRKPESAVVGAPVIGLFPEDNVLYRAQVLEIIGNQYKVYYIDFGNVSNISKIWPIAKQFMSLPAQAIVCSLNEVAPPGDLWPNPDQFSKYFDKDRYNCKFVNKDEEKTYVNIFNDKDDIRQMLIRDGLALSTEQIIPDIEIPLLLGQQFRAIVKSVNNLSDIIIALECGVALSCKMHNLENAGTQDENCLKQFLERAVIVYVDNIIDDSLEITLYDTEGTKIEVISPDEGACDMVELPCPILILRSTLSGYASFVDETSVFIQPSEYLETITYLLDQMFESYENTTQEVAIIPEVELLYAAKSEDGNWYRARVINISDTGASIFYIDYGNTEDVAFDQLRQLSDKFLEICTLCVQVTVTTPTNGLMDQDVVATIYYGENGWEGTVAMQTPIESFATEAPVAGTQQTEIVEAQQEPVELPQQLSTPAEDAPEVSLPVTETTTENVQNGIQVVVSHIDSPTEFYLQLSDSLTAIEELQLNLQEEAVNMPVLENPTAGVLCAAPYSLDQQWYRAEVLDADDDITTVRFIDYGNTDVISNSTTSIKTLPPNLLSLAVYATRSSLKLKPVEGEWSSAAIEKFEALIGENSITAECIDQDEKTNYVELYSNGQNVKDVLITENLAVPLELTEENKLTCFVSHLNSPSEFWLQLENCVDELEWIAEQLSGAENFPELEDTTPGTLCAALFPDDQMWYRARILSNTVAGLELLFIDYGNSSISSSLRQLPEDLVVTPPLAQKCSLQKPEGIPYWSPQAANKFSEISAEGQTVFTVHKISSGETSVVQLLIDGQDVTSMLLPETEEGRVKNAEDLDNLVIEKNGEILGDNYKLEPLPGMTWTEGSTEKLKELIDQGTKLFQIELLPDNIVRLYVNGADIRTTLGGIKTSSLNASKTSTDDNKSDEAYLNETIPEPLEENHQTDIENAVIENKLETTSNKITEDKYLQSSSDDIKCLLGITPENTELQDINTEIETNRVSDTKPDSNKSSDDFPNNQTNLDTPTDAPSIIEVDARQESKLSEKPRLPETETRTDLEGENSLDELKPSLHPPEAEVQDYAEENNEVELQVTGVNADISSCEGKQDEAEENEVKKDAQENLEGKVALDAPDIEDEISSRTNDAKEEPESKVDLDVTPVKTDSPSREEDLKDVEENLEGKVEHDAPDTGGQQNGAKEEPESKVEHIDNSSSLNQEPEVCKSELEPLQTDATEERLDSEEKVALVAPIPTQPIVDAQQEDFKSGVPVKSDEAILGNESNDAPTLKTDTSDDIKQDKSELSESQPPEILEIQPRDEVEEKIEPIAEQQTPDISNPEVVSPNKDNLNSESDKICKDSSPGSPEKSSSSPKIPEKQSIESLSESEVALILRDVVENALAGKVEEQKVKSRPTSRCSGKINFDDRIIPGAVSRPHSPLQDDDKEQKRSRPASACSGKISHDERIVPAAASRPHSPIPSSVDGDGKETQDEK